MELADVSSLEGRVFGLNGRGFSRNFILMPWVRLYTIFGIGTGRYRCYTH